MVNLIADIKGTLTNFKKHVEIEDRYFRQKGIEVIAQIDALNKTGAKAKYEQLLEYADKKHPKHKSVLVPERGRVAEIGYRTGELSLQSAVHDGVEETLAYMYEDGVRIILVGLSTPESTRESLATVRSKSLAVRSLDNYVHAIYNSKEVGSKTDGTAYRTIAEREGISLAESMYLDDKLKQAEGAARAGVAKALWVLDDNEVVDTSLPIITDFREVVKHYDELKREISR